MSVAYRLFFAIALLTAPAGIICAQAMLQGTVSFLNSGSRPAAGVDISAFGASTVATTESGMFILKFPDKKPGDKVRIIVGGKDRNGTPLELVNDKVLAQVRIPSNPDDDIVEIIVCKVGQRNDVALRYNGIIVRTINEATEKRLREIDEKLGAAKIDAETIVALQNEKEKLAAERDSALAKAEEQALFIASINLDKANRLVREAVLKVDSLQDIPGAIAILDNEMLYRAYLDASEKKKKAEAEIQQVVEGFEFKIKLLEPLYRYGEMAECYEKIAEVYATENYDQEKLAWCYNYTAVCLYKNGNFRQAVEFNLKSLNIQEKILPATHLYIANSCNNLAGMYLDLGEHAKALEFNLKALAIEEAVLPAGHILLARTYNNIALIYLRLAEYSKSLEYNLKALNIREKELPAGHPDLAVSYNNLAQTYRALGLYQKELEFNIKSLEINEKTLAADHPTVGKSYNNIAAGYSDLGEYQKALDFNKKALAIWEKVLPSEHLDLSISYNNLALNYIELGDYRQALKFNLKSLEIRKNTLSPDHPQVAQSYHNLGLIYNYLNEHQKSLEYYLNALNIYKKIFPDNHPELITSYNSIAAVYRNLFDFQKALEYNLKALKIAENIFTGDHPKLAETYHGIASTYLELKEYDKALQYALKSTDIYEKILPAQNPTLATAYNNLSAVYFKTNEYEKALELNLKSMVVREKGLPSDHPDLLLTYNNLATLYGKLKNYQAELEYHLKVLGIREKILPADHPDIAWSYSNLSNTYGKLGSHQLALEFNLKSMAIDEKVLSPADPDWLIYYLELSTKYSNLNKFDDAIYWANKAANKLTDSIPDKQSTSFLIHQALINYYKKRGLQYRNNDLYIKAIADFDTVLAAINDGDTYNLRGICYYNLKRYDQAISNYQNAVKYDSTLSKTTYLNNIGTAYVKKGDFLQAKSAFETFEKLDPQNGRAFRNWAMYYALQNDKLRALENLQKAVALGYKDLKWITTDDSLENIRGEQGYKEVVEQLKKL